MYIGKLNVVGRRTWLRTCMLALALGVAGHVAAVWADDAPRPPNIVLIMADDLGVGELGCYGQKIIRTPHLDRLAAEGMRFTQFYSGSPVCAPARCTLMTGKHGGQAAIRDNREVRPEGQWPVAKNEIFLTELLKQRGYANAAIGKWGLGFFGSEGDPLARGVDFFFGYNCQRHAHNHYPTYIYRNAERVELPGNAGRQNDAHYTQDMFIDESLKFVRENRARPFFLYVPLAAPHLAIQVPDASLAEYDGQIEEEPYEHRGGYVPHPRPRAGYAAMVSHMDRGLGQLFALLKELDLERNTIVLFTSDNGPTHGRLAGADSTYFNSTAGGRGRKGDVYEGGLKVPLLVRWPGRIEAGSTSDLPAYFPDFLPTLLDLIGAADQVPAGVNGVSFAPTLLGQPERQKKADYLFWEFRGYGGQQAVRLGDWKGLRRGMMRGNLTIELYNLADDPAEEHDLAAARPEVTARIAEIMRTARTPNADFPLPVLGDAE